MNQFRVWRFKNSPVNMSYFPVATVDTAVKKIIALAEADLKDDSVTMNGFGLEVYSESEHCWEEYYDENGFDIQQIMDGEADS